MCACITPWSLVKLKGVHKKISFCKKLNTEQDMRSCFWHNSIWGLASNIPYVQSCLQQCIGGLVCNVTSIYKALPSLTRYILKTTLNSCIGVNVPFRAVYVACYQFHLLSNNRQQCLECQNSLGRSRNANYRNCWHTSVARRMVHVYGNGASAVECTCPPSPEPPTTWRLKASSSHLCQDALQSSPNP